MAFVKYLCKSHINFANIALHDTGTVMAENVVNGKSFGFRVFANMEAAQDWYDSLPGSGVGKLLTAIDTIARKPAN